MIERKQKNKRGEVWLEVEQITNAGEIVATNGKNKSILQLNICNMDMMLALLRNLRFSPSLS